MKEKITTLIRATAGAAILLTAVAGTANAAYYAKTISGTTVYSLQADSPNGGITSSTFWQGGTSLAGIATHGNYAFVSDNTADGAVLHVISLGGKYVGKVALSTDGRGVQRAGAVSVDSKGRVYVADMAQNSSARFASVYAPNWSDLNSGLDSVFTSITGNWQIDAAAYKNGAVVIRRNDNLDPDGNVGGVRAGTVDQNGVFSDRGLVQDSPAIPVAVTTDADAGNTYILSNTTTINANYQYVRTVTVMGRDSNWTDFGSTTFAGAIGHDLTFISDGLTDSLAMVGVYNGGLQAWKVGITDGVVTSGSSAAWIADDASAAHRVAASSDGKMLWVTAQATGMVYGVDFGNWGTTLPAVGTGSVGALIGDIAVHDAVPEPSSIVSLLAFGAGTLGFWRRRK